MAANTKIRISPAAAAGQSSPSQTPRLREAHLRPRIPRLSDQIDPTSSRASNQFGFFLPSDQQVPSKSSQPVQGEAAIP